MRENIFTFRVPQSENTRILPQTDRFYLYDPLFFCTPPKGKYYPFDRQYLPIDGFKVTFNGVIQLPSLSGHEFPHKRSPIQSPIEGIPRRIRLSDPTVGSLPLSGIICPIEGVLLTIKFSEKGTMDPMNGHFSPINGLDYNALWRMHTWNTPGMHTIQHCNCTTCIFYCPTFSAVFPFLGSALRAQSNKHVNDLYQKREHFN